MGAVLKAAAGIMISSCFSDILETKRAVVAATAFLFRSETTGDDFGA